MSNQRGSTLHNSDGGSRLSKRRSCIVNGIVRDDLSFPTYETHTRVTASAPALPVVETEKPAVREVSEDHDLKCPICLEIVQGACETSCGHCFCAKCLISYFGRAYECPMCRQKIEFVHPSFVLRRMVEAKYPEQAADLHKKQKQKILDDNLRMAFSLRRGLSKEIHVVQHRSSTPEHHKHANVIVVALLMLAMLPTIFWICHSNFTSGSELQPAQINQQKSKHSSARVPATSTIQVPSQQHPTMEQQLVLAAGKGDVPTIQSLIKAGVNPSCQPPPLLSSPLWVAAANGSIEAVEALLSLGADVNGVGREMSVAEIDGDRKDVPSSSETELKWMPALGIAAMRGHSKVVQFLIENHADTNPEMPFYGSPLHLACQNGHREVVRLLLDSGANLQSTDRLQYSPLHKASAYGQTSIAQMLIDAGAPITSKSLMQLTPLYLACRGGHVETTKLLLSRLKKKGESHLIQSLDAVTTEQATPLYVAAEYGHTDIVEILVKAGSKIDAKLHTGASPLLIASQRGFRDITRLLVDAGADTDAVGALRFNALHLATIRGDEEIVGILLENGITTEAVSERGETAMSIACTEKQEKPTLVDLFLKYGVAPPSTYSPSLSPIIQGVERVVCTIMPSNDGVVGTTITMNTVSTLKELSVRIQKAYAMAVTAITHSGQRFSIDPTNPKGRTKALPTLQALLMQQSSCTGSLLQECPGVSKPYKLSFHVSLKELAHKSPFRKSG